MEQRENILDMRRLWRAVKKCKWIYLASVVFFTGIGVWMAVKSLPKYEVEGQMLIGEIGYDSDNRSGSISQMMKTFSVGGFSASTVDNEVVIIQSHDVMLRTVRAIGLNRTYVGKDGEGKKAMLYQNTPVRVEAPAEYFDSLQEAFTIKIELLEGGKANVKAVKGLMSRVLAEAEGVALPYLLKTPYGTLNIMPTELFASSPYRKLTVGVCGNEAAATQLGYDIEIDVASKLSDVINVNLKYANPKLGMAVVDGIMTEYNAKRLDRLHETSVASIKYYDERIAETFEKLQKREQEVAEYQRKNELMGVDSELELLVGASVGKKEEIATQNYNIAYYETVLNILRNRLYEDVQIPQMETMNDPNVAAYNGMLLERAKLKKSATESNDVLIELNKRIDEVRNLIIENSQKMIAKAKADVGHTQAISATAQKRLDEYPDYQLEFGHLLRDKEYINTLYEYLIGQRENSVLQFYSQTDIGFVFQPAYVVKASGILKKLVWPVALFIFGVFAASCFAVMLMLFQRKVKDSMDVAFLGIESRTVKATVGNAGEAVNSLRNKFVSNPAVRTIYVAGLCDTAAPAIRQLTDAFTAIGRSVEVVENLKSNDEILTPDFAKIVGGAERAADYVVVNVPQPYDVRDIELAVDAPDAALLAVVPAGRIKRSSLKSILKGQTVDKVYCMIKE